MSRRIAYNSRLTLDNKDTYDDISPKIPGVRKAYSNSVFASLKRKKTNSWDKKQSCRDYNKKNESALFSRREIIGGLLGTLVAGPIVVPAIKAELTSGREFNIRRKLEEVGVPKKKIENIIKSVVAIDNGIGAATGFFISDNIILTAKHVLENPGFYRNIIDINGKSHEIIDFNSSTRGLYDTENDLALIKIAGKGDGYLDFAHERDKNTTKVSIGFSQGIDKPSLTFGKELKYDLMARMHKNLYWKRSLSNIGINKNMKVLSNPARPGDSGSPVLNTQGNVVGVITAGGNYNSIMEPLGDMQEFINKVKKN